MRPLGRSCPPIALVLHLGFYTLLLQAPRRLADVTPVIDRVSVDPLASLLARDQPRGLRTDVLAAADALRIALAVQT